MFGRALHRQPRVGSPQPQEKVLRPAGVRHLYNKVSGPETGKRKRVKGKADGKLTES